MKSVIRGDMFFGALSALADGVGGGIQPGILTLGGWDQILKDK